MHHFKLVFVPIFVFMVVTFIAATLETIMQLDGTLIEKTWTAFFILLAWVANLPVERHT